MADTRLKKIMPSKVRTKFSFLPILRRRLGTTFLHSILGLSGHLSASGPRMKAPQRKPNIRMDMVACSEWRLNNCDSEKWWDLFCTLLCQLRSQTSPHSATMVGSVKVRFSQVATLLVKEYWLGLRAGVGDHLVVKAGIGQGLLAPAAGERGLPPHKCILDHQEGGVDLWFIQPCTALYISSLTLRRQRTATYLTCCLPDSPISRKTLSISMTRHLGDLLSNCQVFVMLTMIITSSVQDIMEKCNPDKSSWWSSITAISTGQQCFLWCQLSSIVAATVCEPQLSARARNPAGGAPSLLPGSVCKEKSFCRDLLATFF